MCICEPSDDLTPILHGLKDAAIEIMDLHARINAIEQKMEKVGVAGDVCVCNECEREGR